MIYWFKSVSGFSKHKLRFSGEKKKRAEHIQIQDTELWVPNRTQQTLVNARLLKSHAASALCQPFVHGGMLKNSSNSFTWMSQHFHCTREKKRGSEWVQWWFDDWLVEPTTEKATEPTPLNLSWKTAGPGWYSHAVSWLSFSLKVFPHPLFLHVWGSFIPTFFLTGAGLFSVSVVSMTTLGFEGLPCDPEV